jgi:hypothetical protein
MKHKNILLVFAFMAGFAAISNAQDSSKFYFTTAVGIFAPVSAFSKAYENSLALNSGIEYQFSRHYFIQFVLDYNAVKYNQQVKDENSSYLFQHTNSSVFLAGFNLGRNISISKSGKIFASPYVGFGYANIGEPRLTLKNTGIIEQHVTRMTGVYAKQGIRVGYKTASKILQTLYVDVAYLSANIRVQDSRPKAFSFLAGTRFGF